MVACFSGDEMYYLLVTCLTNQIVVSFLDVSVRVGVSSITVIALQDLAMFGGPPSPG